MSRLVGKVLIGSSGILVAIGIAVLIAANPATPPNRADQWKKVDEAVNKGLPKTAIEELEPIIAAAMKDKAYPEAIKAIAKKIALEGNIQGNKPEEKITRMKAEIAKAPTEMVPVMDAILAHWYWHYFQQNRWRFMQRTATAAAPGEDFTTWDLPRLFAEIDKQFTKALRRREGTEGDRRSPTYDALLEKGTMPDAIGRRCTTSSPSTRWSSTRPANRPGPRRRTRSSSPPDSPALGTRRRVPEVEAANDRRRFADGEGDQALPEPADVPQGRQGQVRLSRRRPVAAALRPRQRLRRGEERRATRPR